MYIPAQFKTPRLEDMYALMTAHPLATVVTQTEEGLDANPIPLLLSAGEGEHGVLRGHVARANPIWQATGSDALVIFQGADAYITPSWYPTKQETGKVVPTWNYAVVHAHGRLLAIQDATWIRRHLELLTACQEQQFSVPWTIGDAPADFIEHLINQVVGIEIQITRLEGKWKVSQNQPSRNRQGVTQGLRAQHGAGCPMAQLV